MIQLARPSALLAATSLTWLASSGCGGDANLSTSSGNTWSTSSEGGNGGGGNVGGAGTGGPDQSGGASTSSTSGTTTAPPDPFCGDAHLDPGEACDDGNPSPFDGCRPDCTLVPPISAPPLQWTYVEVPGTQCLDGTPAGFGVSLAPDSKNVMIYLEGGGACFNDLCDFSALSVPFIPPPDGIFNRDNPGNPVRDWSMIYVPYCTGDIHGGDKDSMLGGQLRHFHGYRNITTYLEQWVPTFPDADKVLLAGISAGGFGAGLNAAQVAEAFGPGPQMIVIDDSGPPLAQNVIAPCLQAQFRDVWGLDQTILAACGPDCPDPDDFAGGWLAHVTKTYPNTRFGVFSNTADLVIRTFMGFGWGNGQLDHCDGIATTVPAKVYHDGLLALRNQYVDRSGTYLIGPTHFEYNFGQNHTALRSPSFWTTVIDGTQLSDWVGGVIEGDIQHIGP